MKKYLLLCLTLLSVITPAFAQMGTFQPSLDLLFWDARQTNSSWATTLTFSDNATHIIQSNPDFNARTGFKAGLAYLPCDHEWDAKLYWTYYSTYAKSAIPPNLQIVTSLFFSGSFFISENIFFGADAKWNLRMNMLDMEISHTFKPISTLSFTPRIGLKGGSINQSLNINWNAIIYNATENLTNNYTGIGPSFGLNAKWLWFSNLSLVSDIGTALMYGRWNDTDVYQRPLTLFTTATTISTAVSHSRLGTLMMDYYLGLEWHHEGQSIIDARLGYEIQYWPGQLRLLAVQQLPTLGDLTFQGVTCGISISL